VINNALSSQQLDSEYELYAIINHVGSFISGHYFTLAESQSGNWYCFNDDRVRKVSYIRDTCKDLQDIVDD